LALFIKKRDGSAADKNANNGPAVQKTAHLVFRGFTVSLPLTGGGYSDFLNIISNNWIPVLAGAHEVVN
jgi:hypothetical protein